MKKLKQKRLYDIKQFIPSIIVNLKYATTDNLTWKKLYDDSTCYLHEIVINSLIDVQNELSKKWLGLKIRDWYRPQSVQDILVKHVNNKEFTPSVSNHSKGVAVDVTLIYLQTGEEMHMPTEFDNLSKNAYPTYSDLSEEVIMNRDLLIWLMESHWFKVYPHERWHFDYVELLDLEPLDIKI